MFSRTVGWALGVPDDPITSGMSKSEGIKIQLLSLYLKVVRI